MYCSTIQTKRITKICSYNRDKIATSVIYMYTRIGWQYLYEAIIITAVFNCGENAITVKQKIIVQQKLKCIYNILRNVDSNDNSLSTLLTNQTLNVCAADINITHQP